MLKGRTYHCKAHTYQNRLDVKILGVSPSSFFATRRMIAVKYSPADSSGSVVGATLWDGVSPTPAVTASAAFLMKVLWNTLKYSREG